MKNGQHLLDIGFKRIPINRRSKRDIEAVSPRFHVLGNPVHGFLRRTRQGPGPARFSESLQPLSTPLRARFVRPHIKMQIDTARHTRRVAPDFLARGVDTIVTFRRGRLTSPL